MRRHFIILAPSRGRSVTRDSAVASGLPIPPSLPSRTSPMNLLLAAPAGGSAADIRRLRRPLITAIMQLIERGVLAPDDAAGAHVPFAVTNPFGGEVTISQLFTHTARLGSIHGWQRGGRLGVQTLGGCPCLTISTGRALSVEVLLFQVFLGAGDD